jgi:glutamate-1-semialdehyde 2,1-aminomutase
VAVSVRDTKSSALYGRALKYLPGGVNSPVRAMRSIGARPDLHHRAEGAEITDVTATATSTG